MKTMIEITRTESKLKGNIRRLRECQMISSYRLAKEAGIEKSYYYRLEKENYHVQPTFEVLEKLANYYNIQVFELFI